MAGRPDDMTLSVRERDLYGATVTFKHRERGQLFTRVFDGTTVEAVTAAAEYCDGLGPGWGILVISTPVTIYRDLQGTRNVAPSPERRMLALVGRTELACE